ncbi:polymorphic toxin-type HINT domain-containing protein [Streptomyces sp. NBC_01142]|uniref:polymorphic toxin-type HINT domain-containing protein n=1 Tax=Streptomyces sp. NBC_01142 TaxID=2975865 RepID=UPI002257E6CA|nr:polymorphic toxin-type HINT domain-containing protein [Streptomyces sp. NBC_01142]MCX4825999.1 polymorphic toxin-type HINT domain-containing protein [Streptomyces sp. NBC_01142]
MVVPLGLAPVAEAEAKPGGLGRPDLPQQRVSKVKAVNSLGAKKAREKVAKDEAANAELARRARAEQEAAWPKPGTATVRLVNGKAGNASPGGMPVTVGPLPAKTATAADRQTQVTVLDQNAAQNAGITGVLLTAETNAAHTAALSVDYSKFASAIGGGWSQRLRLVQMPACVLSTPEAAACRKQTPLKSDNDVTGQSVSAHITLPEAKSGASTQLARSHSGSGAMVLALTAAAAGTGQSPTGSGDYSATELSASSAWEAGSSSGSFTWSYGFTMPPAAAGPTPNLSLSYDSGTIDGRTATTNNQGTSVGEGFALSESYIERAYGSCDEDGQEDVFDQCWTYDNARLVLNGKSDRLVKHKDPGKWKLAKDDASQVTRSTGADNGDDNGEYWTVVTGDGTKYVFGLDKLDGAGTQRTNSTWTVPVFGDDSAEPGYAEGTSFAGRSLTQAWRWNLDYVEDTSGNASTYWYAKDSNHYKKNKSETANASYIRGGYLKDIKYGLRKGALFTDQADARVTFGYAERCTVSDCTELTKDTADKWPDVPFDAICSKDDDECNAAGPSFFTRKRLTDIHTYSYNATKSDYDQVDAWELEQKYEDGGDLDDTSDHALTLKSLKRWGKSASSPAQLKPISFTYQMRPNRVDAAENILPLTRPRISTITSETGGITTVTLSSPECRRGEVLGSAEDANTRSCYPQYWHINGAQKASVDWFHKYRVLAVVVSDPTGHNDAVEHTYDYAGAGWHYSDEPFTPKDERTWSDWRGYRQVTVYGGAKDTTRSKTVSLYLQGMHGDKKADGTTRSVTVPALATPALGIAGIEDAGQYTGQLRQQVTYNGSTPVSAVANEPWSTETARQDKVPDADDHVARYVRTKKSTNYSYLTVPKTWRSRTTDTDYDSYGMPYQAEDLGDNTKSGDETCTRTWYARNGGLTSLISRSRTVAKPCAVTDAKLDLPADDTRRGDVLSDTAVAYDGATWSPTAEPKAGMATWTGRAKAYTAAGAVTWQKRSTTNYDGLGRPLSVTDAAGNATSTAYTPTDAGPLTKTITTNAKGHRSVSFLDPRRGLTLRSYDANQKLTEVAYDGLGRLTDVWLPDRIRSSQSPNSTFAYHLDNTSESSVATSTLKRDGKTYNTTHGIFDSLLRPLQTQSPTPQGGRLLTDTRYDSRGLAYETHAGIFDNKNTPNGTYTRAEYGEAPNQTQTVFDGAGRPTSSTLYVYGAKKWSTSSSYTGDSTATTALAGGLASRTITDARGSTVESRQYVGESPADAEYGGGLGTLYASTKFASALDGLQTSVTGPDKAEWTYTYDLFGRQVVADDPDKGKTTSVYNDLDQVIKSSDARGKSVLTAYDSLGRPTGTWSGSQSDANQITANTYDTLVKGQPDTSTRYLDGKSGQAYTKAVTKYDSLSRPVTTQLKLPAADPLIKSGTPSILEFSSYYNIDGTLQNTKEPALGGLASEIIGYDYNELGQVTAVGGSTGYLLDTDYSALSQPQQFTMGTANTEDHKKSYVTNTYEEGTGRLTRSHVTDQTHPYMLQDLNYGFDPAGNITSITDPTTLGGTSSAETQCFSYDGHRRLTEAWTPASQKCADPRSPDNLSGPAPYSTSYAYNTAGQRTSETQHKPAGDTKTTYCYKGDQPHALTGTSTKADCAKPDRPYSYDATGNTTKRPGKKTPQDLIWSERGELTKLTEDGKSTTYIYDADGTLLIRSTENGERILYAGTTELHLEANGTTWAQRYYTSGGRAVAARSNESGTPKLSYLAGDHHGTQSLSITADSSQTITKRYMSPFGAERGTPTGGTWPDDKGFLGKTRDETTGLTHIGARQYDPSIGQFISVDPLLETDKAQTLNGYSYSINNPLTFTDPTGLGLACGGAGGSSEACPTRPDGSKGNGRPNEAVDYSKPRPEYPCTSGCGESSIEETLLNLMSRDDERLPIQWIGVFHRVDGASYWEAAVGDGDRTAMACFGRAGCREAYRHLMKTGDLAAAKKIAATYCLVHTEQCASEAADYQTAQEVLDMIPELLATVYGVRVGKLCGKCFLAGTDVLMADGETKDIEDVEIGDKVLATDPETGKSGPREVTRLIVTQGDKYFNKLSIATSDGIRTLTATHEHPFWSPSEHRWVEAAELAPGMTLLTDDGHTVILTANHAFTRHARTYNLTVDDLHTYYVLAGETPVLVHNSNCPGIGPGWFPYGSEKIPGGWSGPNMTSKFRKNANKQGFVWRAPKGQDSVRIDRGDPNSQWGTQQVDHVVINSGGRVVGRGGELLPPNARIQDYPAEAHIPLSEWQTWRSWNAP